MFKVGDRVRYTGVYTPLVGKEGGISNIEDIDTVHVLWDDGEIKELSCMSKSLTLISDTKTRTDEELAEAFREGYKSMMDAEKELKLRGFSVLVGGLNVVTDGNVFISKTVTI